MFTKEHYNIIAKIIADTHTWTDGEDEVIYDIVERLIEEFANDNPRFDAQKFRNACGLLDYK